MERYQHLRIQECCERQYYKEEPHPHCIEIRAKRDIMEHDFWEVRKN